MGKIEILWMQPENGMPYYIARYHGVLFIGIIVTEGERSERKLRVLARKDFREEFPDNLEVLREMLPGRFKMLHECPDVPEELLRELERQISLESL